MLSLRVRVEDLAGGRTTEHAFRKSPVHIGRNELNELVLSQGFVSMWHAIVRFDQDVIEYVDLGSTNGTLLNGVRIGDRVPTEIKPGTDLRIGSLRLHL